MDRHKGYWDNWTNIEQEHKVLTLCTSKGVSAFYGIVCKGSLLGHEQGGVEQSVNLYQVRLVFIGKLGFHADLIKIETGHSRNRVQQKGESEQEEKFRTILIGLFGLKNLHSGQFWIWKWGWCFGLLASWHFSWSELVQCKVKSKPPPITWVKTWIASTSSLFIC